MKSSQLSAVLALQFVLLTLIPKSLRFSYAGCPRIFKDSARFAPYIVGGDKEFRSPYTATTALIISGPVQCSGSLVGARWVLTAAHCNVSLSATVYIGGTNRTTGKAYNLSRVYNHPAYVRTRYSFWNDVALLRLSSRVKNPRPLPLNYAVDLPKPGAALRETGFGRGDNEFVSSLTLRSLDMRLLNTSECLRRMISGGFRRVAEAYIPKLLICTGRADCAGAGACHGDSGGPLVARAERGGFVQVGVVNFILGYCGNEQTPDVYARIATFANWIFQIAGFEISFDRPLVPTFIPKPKPIPRLNQAPISMPTPTHSLAPTVMPKFSFHPSTPEPERDPVQSSDPLLTDFSTPPRSM